MSLIKNEATFNIKATFLCVGLGHSGPPRVRLQVCLELVGGCRAQCSKRKKISIIGPVFKSRAS